MVDENLVELKNAMKDQLPDSASVVGKIHRPDEPPNGNEFVPDDYEVF